MQSFEVDVTGYQDGCDTDDLDAVNMSYILLVKLNNVNLNNTKVEDSWKVFI